jgi:hypothetical protein
MALNPSIHRRRQLYIYVLAHTHNFAGFI